MSFLRFKMYFILYIIICLNVNNVLCLTCNKILEFPNEKRISLSELQTTAPKEIVECLAHLSRNKLSQPEADFIWNAIVEYHGGIANVPDKVLNLLHWVTVALKPEDYGNITLSNIDVISNFGFDYNLQDDQLTAICERVREDFASKTPEDYTFYDLSALRQILCAFNRSEIERIHPVAYREAALIISKLKKCSAEVLKGFATLAVHENAFGSPRDWTNSTLEAIGQVADYLPQNVKTLKING